MRSLTSNMEPAQQNEVSDKSEDFVSLSRRWSGRLSVSNQENQKLEAPEETECETVKTAGGEQQTEGVSDTAAGVILTEKEKSETDTDQSASPNGEETMTEEGKDSATPTPATDSAQDTTARNRFAPEPAQVPQQPADSKEQTQQQPPANPPAKPNVCCVVV